MPRSDWQLDGLWRRDEATDTAQPGQAIAQKYGIGAGWLQRFDRRRICGESSWCATISRRDALKYYSIGTPYVVHSRDFSRLMARWWAFMPAAYEQVKGDIQLDMYAYNMAAAHLGVRHVTMQHHMVSNPSAGDEGWKEVDALKSMPCREAGLRTASGRPWSSPTFTHACQTYTALSTGGMPKDSTPGVADERVWLFHKGHVPPRILECDHPLLQLPPDNFFDVQTNSARRRRAFMICALHRQVNDAMGDYKRKYCAPSQINLRECVRLTKGGVGDRQFPGRFARLVC